MRTRSIALQVFYCVNRHGAEVQLECPFVPEQDMSIIATWLVRNHEHKNYLDLKLPLKYVKSWSFELCIEVSGICVA